MLRLFCCSQAVLCTCGITACGAFSLSCPAQRDAGAMPIPCLQVDSRVESLPADLWACPHLTRLDLDLKGSAALPAPAAHGAPCLPALQELRLARCRLAGGALPEAVCQLSGLRRLEVVKCGLASCCTSASAGLPPQFSRLCNLVGGGALCV